MLYLDTSLLIAALTHETTTPQVLAWLGRQDVTALAISDWSIAEISSALALKLRTGQLDIALRAQALAEFNALARNSLAVLSVNPAQFRAAALYLDRHDLGLRAGDALHLAVAASHGATVCTLDRRLAQAGPDLGIATLIPV